MEPLEIAIQHPRWVSFAKAVLYTAGFLALTACANIVSPGGGPKDVAPPEVVASTPPSGSVGFSGNTIQIRFSEYIQIPTLQQQILISPPLREKPEFSLKGKTLRIKFADTLLKNTTYALHFGTAIQDITEKNPVPDYSFYFSTGPFIDTLVLEGEVMNAWDGKLEENVNVMLYPADVTDSLLPYTYPRYVTRPDKTGHFRFSHLAQGEYFLMAVSDKNNNLFYDLPNEPVAFSSKKTSPEVEIQAVRDTLGDSTGVVVPGVKTITHKLAMFTGEDSVQRILTVLTEGKYKAVVALRYPLRNPGVTIHDTSVANHAVTQWNRRSDTLTLWIKDFTGESFTIQINGEGFGDTAHVAFRPIPTGPRARQRIAKVFFSMNIARAGRFSPADTPVIEFSMPLIFFHTDEAKLITGTDTLPLLLRSLDTTILFRYQVINPLGVDTLYRIWMPPGAAGGWDGTLNDTLEWSFGRDGADKFGILKVTMNFPAEIKGNLLLYLMDEKSGVLHTRIVAPGATEVFNLLKPGNYRLKAVLDTNFNGVWDTGDFKSRRQPEKVVILGTPMPVKTNWEEEFEWNINFEDR